MRAYERFLKYVKINTSSNPDVKGKQPTSDNQFKLAKVLVEEMKELGFENPAVDEHCYVYGWLAASKGCENAAALGLIAHIDTSPDLSGENVKPILHENYDGGDVVLPNGHVIATEIFPELVNLKGDTLITASGDTLLGADDKAGIAEILTACERIIAEDIMHPRICVGFTPDEEVGAGADKFNVEKFGAAYAYTIDGGEVGEIEYESFNAASAKISFKGISVHPGSAKNKMLNAIKMAIEFNKLLPEFECPECTEDREGFYHLTNLCGSVESATLEYIIRDHDRDSFENRKDIIIQAVETLSKQFGKMHVSIELEDSYYNMGEMIEKNFHLVENASAAIVDCGLTPITKAIRGGTDGSRLSFMGLPCPNLGTGGFFAHGPNECATVERMDKAVDIILTVVQKYAKQSGNKPNNFV